MKDFGKMLQRTLTLVLLLALISAVSAADGITMEKRASKAFIRENDTLDVSIWVVNNGETTFRGVIDDYVPQYALASPEDGNFTGGFAPKVSFNVVLSPKESKELVYRLSFPAVPLTLSNKTVNLGFASFLGEDNTMAFKSNTVSLTFLPRNFTFNCNFNFKCEPALGENSVNCSQDCIASQKDLYCDSEKNSVCDPDCPEKDPDCFNETKTSCGNGLCEADENITMCPSDCATTTTRAGDNGEGFTTGLLIIMAFVVALVIVAALLRSRSGEQTEDLEDDVVSAEDIADKVRKKKF